MINFKKCYINDLKIYYYLDFSSFIIDKLINLAIMTVNLPAVRLATGSLSLWAVARKFSPLVQVFPPRSPGGDVERQSNEDDD